jgi:hypothetical protein
VARNTQPTGQQADRGPRRERRRAARQERKPIDAPVRQGGYDAEDLVGESQFSAEQAGERGVSRARHTGGPPSDDPFTVTPDGYLGRRYLEEATQSPAHEHYEPGADDETEPEAEWSHDPDEEIELEAEAQAALDEIENLEQGENWPPARRRR